MRWPTAGQRAIRAASPSATALSSPVRRGLSSRAFLLAVLLVGCSDTTGPEEETDPGDGRYHPSASGVRVDELWSCNSVSGAIRDRALELGCSTTLRPCPELLRTQFQTPCMQYDRGTVDGCVSFYGEQGACSALDPTHCALVAYPGTEPAGCPQ